MLIVHRQRFVFVRLCADSVTKVWSECRNTELSVYGIGFWHYFDLLSYKEAKVARAVLLAFFHNSAQLSRYRTGKFRISPDMKAEIDRLLEENGVSVPLECDAYETDL